MSILVADDFADSAEAVALALQIEGFDAFFVSSGTEALQAISERRPTAAILDLKMPDLDGFELAQKIRTSPDESLRSANLIAHSGLQSPCYREQAVQSGFDYYAVKPCPIEQLTACLSLADTGIPPKLILPTIDSEKMFALSERSQRAVKRARNIRATYRHLYKLLQDSSD